jgi:hypothetical protein
MAFGSLTSAVLNACMSAFGEDVVYTPQGGSAATVSGIFNAQTYVIEQGVPVLSYQPSLGLKVSDLASNPRIGDSVSVRSVSYKVVSVDVDGEGGAVLSLQKTA